jgi:hypothetical protein
MLVEMREQARFKLKLPAIVGESPKKNNKSFHNMMTANVSSGGAFFVTDLRIPIGTEVGVCLEIGDAWVSDSVLNAKGVVVRHDEEGIAVRFTSTNIKRKEIISSHEMPH